MFAALQWPNSTSEVVVFGQERAWTKTFNPAVLLSGNFY
jgi:hypothetical protein